MIDYEETKSQPIKKKLCIHIENKKNDYFCIIFNMKSRMKGIIHARFDENVEVKLLCMVLLLANVLDFGSENRKYLNVKHD